LPVKIVGDVFDVFLDVNHGDLDVNIDRVRNTLACAVIGVAQFCVDDESRRIPLFFRSEYRLLDEVVDRGVVKD